MRIQPGQPAKNFTSQDLLGIIYQLKEFTDGWTILNKLMEIKEDKSSDIWIPASAVIQ
jgi:hypothetical protein